MSAAGTLFPIALCGRCSLLSLRQVSNFSAASARLKNQWAAQTRCPYFAIRRPVSIDCQRDILSASLSLLQALRGGFEFMEEAVQHPGLHLRVANSDDMDAAYELFAQVQTIHADAAPDFFRRPEKDEKFKQFFNHVLNDPNQHIMFCCADGSEIGYVHYFLGVSPETIYQPERRIAHIGQLAVKSEHQRSGCATKLIEHVKEEARCQGILEVALEFWMFNVAARACFEKAGFEMNQGSMCLTL